MFFSFSPRTPGEMIQFDEHNTFQDEVTNQHLVVKNQVCVPGSFGAKNQPGFTTILGCREYEIAQKMS